MKTTLTLLAVGLLCTDARRGQQQGHSRGRGALNVLEACSSEIDFTCTLDVSATDLVETLTAHKAEVDEWKANGKEGDKPERPSDDVKASLQEVRECMKAIKPELAEDSDCLAALSVKGGKGGRGNKDKENENDGPRRGLAARDGGRRGKGKGGKALKVLEACSSEIDFTCTLDVSATDLVETLTAHKADVDEWKASGKEGDKPERPSDDVKASLEEVRQCMKAIKPELAEDSDCLAALSVKGGKGGRGDKDKENENDGARRGLAARDGGRRGKGKGGKALKVLEACSSEIDFTCTLDVSATDLVETLIAHKAEVDEWKANGKEGDKPQRPSDEVKASLEEVRQCMKAIKPELAEDSDCLAALSVKSGKGGRGDKDKENENDDARRGLAARDGGRHGKGKGGKGKGRKVVQAITACGDEIESSCALNFDIYALADAMSALKAAREEANARGEEPASVPEEVKEQAQAVGACVRDIKDNSQCLSAALARPGRDGLEDNDADDK